MEPHFSTNFMVYRNDAMQYSCPTFVFTKPGVMLRKMMPLSLYCTANFAAATFTAAFDMLYPAAKVMLFSIIICTDPFWR